MDTVKQPFEDIDLDEPEKQSEAAGADQTTGESSARLPPFTPLSDIVATYPSLRRPVIEGLLREGETGNLIAAPKIGKSWLVGSLALSLAADCDWLGMFPCHGERCLIIDAELHRETLANRLPKIANRMGVSAGCLSSIDIWALRGCGAPLPSLAERLRQTQPGQYALVLLDAWYRFLPDGISENANAEIMGLYNLLDSYADHLKAAWLNVHHASKGDQSGKGVTDVGAGAGAQSRAADTHLIVRPHEQDNVAVVHAAVRSWPPVEPFCIRWDYPLWMLDEDASPAQLKRPQTAHQAAQKAKDEEGLAAITAKLAGKKTATKKMLRGWTGYSRDRVDRLMDIMESQGQVCRREIVKRGKPCDEYWLTPITDDDENTPWD